MFVTCHSVAVCYKTTMQSKTPAPGQSAFTITECLVVLAVTAFLLVLPCLSANASRERINRMVCLNNMRQMGVGSQMYAAEDPKGRLAGSLPPAGSTTAAPKDDLNWLYGYGPSRSCFVQDLKTFICPATRNYIRTNEVKLTYNSQLLSLLLDLYENAGTTSSPGHSYEVVSYWAASSGYPDKTLQSVATHRNTKGPFAGVIPGPAMVLLMHDAMDVLASGGVENYPNAHVGHGIEGGNMLFTDGHAEWVGTQDWDYRWAVGVDQNTGL